MKWLDDRVNARVGGNDDAMLEKLGYKQELARHLNTFRNFAICFSFLSPITGLTGTFSFSWMYGGPLAIVWGWVIVTAANMIVGLSLAELASAFPTAGGVFYWSGAMGGRRYGPLAAWMTGFFIVLGEIGCTAGVTYTTAILVAQYVLLGTGGAAAGGTALDQRGIVGIYIAIEIFVGLLNTFNVRLLDLISEVSVWFHVVGVTAFVVILPALAPTHQPASWVFGAFTPDMAFSGISNTGFTFLLALLGSSWAMVGYDAAAHMSEETQGAALAGPISLIATILSGFLVGIAYVISLLFSVQNPASLVDPAAATAGGSAPFQIAWDVFTARFGSGFGALGLFVVPLLCSLFCGNACLTTCSRVVWAFSRDGDLRISRILRWVHPKWKTPVAAVWFSVFCQIILVLPALYNYTAFAAVISIGVIGLYISYLVPLLLRLTVFRHRWIPGPFSLGAASIPVACAAVAWICFGTVLFALPQVFPVTGANLNYAPVSVGVVLVLAGTWWVFNAKSWFKGPRGGWGGGGGMDDDTASGAPPAVVVAGGKDADAAAWKRGCC